MCIHESSFHVFLHNFHNSFVLSIDFLKNIHFSCDLNICFSLQGAYIENLLS